MRIQPPHLCRTTVPTSSAVKGGAFFSLAGGFALCLFLATLPVSASLYTQPQGDSQGNWLTNAGPVSGQVKPPETPGALWRVVAPLLHCRAAPSRNAGLIRTFRRGSLLQANLGRGGSDEVLVNALDRAQKPWMLVRSPEGVSYQCYVRAHRRFILPLQR